MNEAILKSYKYFTKLIKEPENQIDLNAIIDIDSYVSTNKQLLNLILNSKDTYYWKSIDNFKSINVIFTYIKETISNNKLFSINSVNNFLHNVIGIIGQQLNIESSKNYITVTNKILSLISRPFLDKPLDLKTKINIFINLDLIFKKEGIENKFYDAIEKLIHENEYQINSLIYLLELRRYIKKIKNILEDNIGGRLAKKITSGNCERNSEFCNLVFDNPSNFILAITNIILDNKENDIDVLLATIKTYFNYDLEEFKFDIYKLINDGKKIINHWLKVNKKLNDEAIETFWKEKTLVQNIEKFNSKYLSHKDKYEVLFLIYIGYALDKKYYDLIDIKLNQIINIQQKSKPIDFKVKKIQKSKWVILEKILVDPSLLKSNEWLDGTGDFINIENKINEVLQWNPLKWFNEAFEEYCKDKNISKKEWELSEINLYWKILIVSLYDNKDNLKDNWQNILMFWFLTAIDASQCKSLSQKNLLALSVKELKEKEDKLYIKSSYDNKLAKKHIKNIYGEFVEKLDVINDIVLVDNSMLSIVDKYIFTSYEFMGDIIYKIIINDLKINCVIDYNDEFDPFSHSVQEQICKSINFNDNIQKNRDIYYDEKTISNADYFEVFLYFIYKINGYEKTKNILKSLIEKNYNQLLINEQVLDWINDEQEFFKDDWINNRKLTIPEPIYCSLKRYKEIFTSIPSFKSNVIYNIPAHSFSEFSKIMKDIFKSWIKFIMVDGCYKNDSQLYIDNIDGNKIEISFSKYLDDAINNIVTRFETEQKNIYYYNLYNMHKNNFKDFIEYIKYLITGK